MPVQNNTSIKPYIKLKNINNPLQEKEVYIVSMNSLLFLWYRIFYNLFSNKYVYINANKERHDFREEFSQNVDKSKITLKAAELIQFTISEFARHKLISPKNPKDLINGFNNILNNSEHSFIKTHIIYNIICKYVKEKEEELTKNKVKIVEQNANPGIFIDMLLCYGNRIIQYVFDRYKENNLPFPSTYKDRADLFTSFFENKNSDVLFYIISTLQDIEDKQNQYIFNEKFLEKLTLLNKPLLEKRKADFLEKLSEKWDITKENAQKYLEYDLLNEISNLESSIATDSLISSNLNKKEVVTQLIEKYLKSDVTSSGRKKELLGLLRTQNSFPINPQEDLKEEIILLKNEITEKNKLIKLYSKLHLEQKEFSEIQTLLNNNEKQSLEIENYLKNNPKTINIKEYLNRNN